MWIEVATTKNCLFSYVAYNTELRILTYQVRGTEDMFDVAHVPPEVWRAFPSGVTAFSFYSQYIRGRYPVTQVMDQAQRKRELGLITHEQALETTSQRIARENKEWVERFAPHKAEQPVLPVAKGKRQTKADARTEQDANDS